MKYLLQELVNQIAKEVRIEFHERIQHLNEYERYAFIQDRKSILRSKKELTPRERCEFILMSAWDNQERI